MVPVTYRRMAMEQLVGPVQVFDSRCFEPEVALDVWRGMVDPTFRIDVEPDHRPRFAMSISSLNLGNTLLMSVSLSEQAFRRDRDRVRLDGLDQIGFFLQVAGSRVVRANGREFVLWPGDVQVVDMAQEEETRVTAGRSVSMYLPRDMIERELANVGRFNGVVLRDESARLLRTHLLDLLGSNWPAGAVPYFDRSMTSLALGCLASLKPDPDRLSWSGHGDTRRRIERYIEDHLQDHLLDARRIVLEFGVSRSVLYRAFQIHGGLNRYILGRRLQRVRNLLLAGDSRTIWEIALATGFVTPAHFNREFRRAFGATPTEVRSRQRAGDQAPVGATSLDQVFRSLSL